MQGNMSTNKLNATRLLLTRSANTGSGCADAGALSRPRVSVCACECPCRSLGRPWGPTERFPEPVAAAGGQGSPRMTDSLCPQWLTGELALRRLGRGWQPADAERQAAQRRMRKMKRRSRCVSTGRTRGGRCLR